MLYHDVEQALPFILYLWMFLTPVIYPAPNPGTASLSMLLNPVSAVLDTTRSWFFSIAANYMSSFFNVCGLTLIVLLLGWLVYRLALPILIERVSA
jgi:lipopolysaccharide transport system permease protein